MFQAVSKLADDNVSGSTEQQSVLDQASCETQSLIVAAEPATEQSATIMSSVEKTLAAEGQNASTSCSTGSSSSVSSDNVVSVRTEQTDSASNVSELAKTSKGVVIRPITTTSESNGRRYGYQNFSCQM